MNEAARRAGAPDGAINWMSTVTIEGTQELMKARETAVILATGGMGLVRAAYSAGKPAYGVGPGNAPAYIERIRGCRQGRPRHRHRQDVRQRRALLVRELGRRRRAARRRSEAAVRRQRRALSERGRDRRRRPRARQPAAAAESGARRTPRHLHRAAGRHHRRADDAGADCGARGRRTRLSAVDREALPGPVLLRGADWREGCERCKQILRYGGMGHTMSIHSRNDEVILQFGLKKPAFRIVVNTPTTHGSIGLSTGLEPAMTLGCGGYGGNITSDNIQPRHLLNIKRLAYEVTPVSSARPTAPAPAPGAGLPKAPAAPAPDRHRRRAPGRDASTNSSRPGATWRREPARPARSKAKTPPRRLRPPKPRRQLPPPRRSRSPWILSARTTSGRRYARVASSSSASGRLLRRRRGTSATSIISSSSPNGRGEKRLIFVLPIERIGVSVDHPAAGCYPFFPAS